MKTPNERWKDDRTTKDGMGSETGKSKNKNGKWVIRPKIHLKPKCIIHTVIEKYNKTYYIWGC